jgi:hypothetical protein
MLPVNWHSFMTNSIRSVPKHAEDLSCSSLVLAATEAGEYYNLRIVIDAEATRKKLERNPLMLYGKKGEQLKPTKKTTTTRTR